MRLLFNVLYIFHILNFLYLLLKLKDEGDHRVVVLLAHAHLYLRFQLKYRLLYAVHLLKRLGHVYEVKHPILPGAELALPLLGIWAKFVFHEKCDGTLCLLYYLMFNELFVNGFLVLGAAILSRLDTFLCHFVAVILHNLK
jgi:hypothetical protein